IRGRNDDAHIVPEISVLNDDRTIATPGFLGPVSLIERARNAGAHPLHVRVADDDGPGHVVGHTHAGGAFNLAGENRLVAPDRDPIDEELVGWRGGEPTPR